MNNFYIPFYYLFYTRLKTKMEIISWFLIFIIPQFFITYSYNQIELEIFFPIFMISQIIFHTLYEIGYLENDIITTKKEKNPTLRLDKKSFSYIESNYNKIKFFKYLIIILFTIIVYYIESNIETETFLNPFICLLLVNRVFFYIHNNLRNRFNIITFFILSISKYIFPLLLFIDLMNAFYPILLSIITFPLLRTLEICMLKRHKLAIFKSQNLDLDKFRILYYFSNIIICIIIWQILPLSYENFLVSILVLFYFAFYRVSTYFLIKKGIYKRDIKTTSQYSVK